MSRYTEHGLQSGALEVTCLVESRYGSEIRVATPYREMIVAATPKGQRMTAYMPDEIGYQNFRVVAPNGIEIKVHGSPKYGYSVSAYDEKGYLNGFMLEREEKP